MNQRLTSKKVLGLGINTLVRSNIDPDAALWALHLVDTGPDIRLDTRPHTPLSVDLIYLSVMNLPWSIHHMYNDDSVQIHKI